MHAPCTPTVRRLQAQANAGHRNDHARRAEVARRYAWQAQEQRKNGSATKPDKARLTTLIRLRELERVFRLRYGRCLPDDDAGREDLTLVAHHIAHLHGEVVEHIVGWARRWAPWMPDAEATALAESVTADRRKFTADQLAWALGLSMAERTALKITTIGAVDVGKAERAELRKQRHREAERARRRRKAEAAGRVPGSIGRPRKRPSPCGSEAPKKPVYSRGDSIAVHGFLDAL